jgi:preprotein translocase subunit SecY
MKINKKKGNITLILLIISVLVIIGLIIYINTNKKDIEINKTDT